MLYRDACFLCTTPYQVMGAISITKSTGLEADIYIFNMFSSYKDVAESLKKTGVFADVYAVDSSKYNAPGRKQAFIQMVNCGRSVADFLPKDIVYSTLYASSRAHIKNLVLHELLKRNPKLQIVVYDDGLGMYSKNSHVLITTSWRGMAEKLLGWDLYKPERMTYMVNLPNLFEQPDRERMCPVVQMPRLPWTEENKELLMKVFGVNSTDIIKERVVIFDSLRGFAVERDQKMEFLDSCFTAATACFGKNHVILKPHPRSKKTTSADVNLYNKTGIPVEVLYAGMDDLNDRVLITYASSAVYTPKIFFDAEPWIINLFRITDNINNQVSEWEEPYQKFKKIYREPEKVMAPKSVDEFQLCLKRIEQS